MNNKKSPIQLLAEHIASSNFTGLCRNESNPAISSASDSLLLQYVISGASGGGCYEDCIATEFENSLDYIDGRHVSGAIGYLVERHQLNFDMEKYNHLVKNAITKNDVLEYYHDKEYYGNYTNTEVVGIKIETLVECFKDEDDRKIFITSFKEEVSILAKEDQIKSSYMKIENFKKEIKNTQEYLATHEKEAKKIQNEKKSRKKELQNMEVKGSTDIEKKEVSENKRIKEIKDRIQKLTNDMNEVQKSLSQLLSSEDTKENNKSYKKHK